MYELDRQSILGYGPSTTQITRFDVHRLHLHTTEGHVSVLDLGHTWTPSLDIFTSPNSVMPLRSRCISIPLL
jgi:hypothetical protein